jgi:hypothetical protein
MIPLPPEVLAIKAQIDQVKARFDHAKARVEGLAGHAVGLARDRFERWVLGVASEAVSDTIDKARRRYANETAKAKEAAAEAARVKDAQEREARANGHDPGRGWGQGGP